MKKEKIDKKKTGFSLLKKIMPNNSSKPRESLKFSEEKLKNEKTSLNADSSKIKISKNIQDNINYIKKLIGDDPTVKIREFHTKADTPIKCAAFFLDGLSDDTVISEQFIKPLILSDAPVSNNVLNMVMSEILYGGDCVSTCEMADIVSAILAGDTAIFLDNCDQGIVADTKGYKLRSIEEPQNEKALKGPREGFVENLMTNISLLRRKLQTVDFKIRFFTFGRKSNTKISVCYLDSVVNKKALALLYERLEKIDMDAVLDGNYLEEFITDKFFTSFRTIGDTERPDTAAAKMLEGRIVIMVNGSPSVYTVPYLMIESFQTSDDYYANSFYASFMRVLRIISYFLAIMVPGFFVALISFHNYMLPKELITSFISARQGVPLPTIVECVALLLAFEILRETALRVPGSIGQPLSIVGAIVLGDAAISARYASAPMLIVIAVSCLAGLLVQNTKNSILFFRIFFLVASSILGMYGFLLAFLVFIIHLLSLKSFGVDYFDYNIFKSPQKQKDYLVRAPWWTMLMFPEYLTKAKYRQKSGREK